MIHNILLKFLGSVAPTSLAKKSATMRDPRTGKGMTEDF